MYGYLTIVRRGGIRRCLYNQNLASIRRLFTLYPRGPAVKCDEMSNQFIHYQNVPYSDIHEGRECIEALLKE